jgi:hypothetical protein
MVRAVLSTGFPMFLMWGPELVQIGNDAYAPTLGSKRMQGLPVRTTWAELWDVVGPQFEKVRRTGEPVFAPDAGLFPSRRGFTEEAYFTYCYSALNDEGRIAGVLETSLETTARSGRAQAGHDPRAGDVRCRRDVDLVRVRARGPDPGGESAGYPLRAALSPRAREDSSQSVRLDRRGAGLGGSAADTEPATWTRGVADQPGDRGRGSAGP